MKMLRVAMYKIIFQFPIRRYKSRLYFEYSRLSIKQKSTPRHRTESNEKKSVYEHHYKRINYYKNSHKNP